MGREKPIDLPRRDASVRLGLAEGQEAGAPLTKEGLHRVRANPSRTVRARNPACVHEARPGSGDRLFRQVTRPESAHQAACAGVELLRRTRKSDLDAVRIGFGGGGRTNARFECPRGYGGHLRHVDIARACVDPERKVGASRHGRRQGGDAQAAHVHVLHGGRQVRVTGHGRCPVGAGGHGEKQDREGRTAWAHDGGSWRRSMRSMLSRWRTRMMTSRTSAMANGQPTPSKT